MPIERRLQNREQRETSLRIHAQAALKARGLTKAPINLHQLAEDRSEIRVFSKELHKVCDGLLRWVPTANRFYLYYDPNPFKKRFNLGHELAHYLIDEHHHAIRIGGGFHKSNKQSFIGHRRMEAEANIYAAELLIPGFLFREEDFEPCIEDVRIVADKYDASLQCAARKIIEHSSIPAGLVVSRNGMIIWGLWNAGLVKHGCWGLTHGKRIPEMSATNRAQNSGKEETGSTNACHWFDTVGHRMKMREEVIVLPGHQSMITLLSES